MSGWALLFFRVNAEWTTTWIHAVVMVFVGILYLGLLLFGNRLVREEYPGGSFIKLEGVIRLFRNPVAVLAGGCITSPLT